MELQLTFHKKKMPKNVPQKLDPILLIIGTLKLFSFLNLKENVLSYSVSCLELMLQ